MITNPCPYCGKQEHKALATLGGELIVQCVCGVVYKHIINPDKKVKHYKHGKTWHTPFFNKRYDDISKYLHEKCGSAKTILDIGCATGALLDRLHMLLPDAMLGGVEQSAPLHKYLTTKKYKLHLIKHGFDYCKLKPESFDLIVCMGVDYLFLDHNNCMKKIVYALKPSGRLYIERNVFYDMKSFAGKSVKNPKDLFWTNLLITTWFTEKQMEAQIDKYFNRLDKLDYGEEVSRQVGWLCSRK